MIIVEGSDNSGKTTLVEQLVKDFDLITLVPYKKGPPKDAETNFMNSWCMINGAINFPPKRVITDRFSLIGESIYGPICRKKDLWVSMYDRKIKLFNSMIALDPFIIYCRPPDNRVLNMSTHQRKYYDSEEHVQQIINNRALILNAYDNYFAFWRNHNFYKYDYTISESYLTLKERLKEYLK